MSKTSFMLGFIAGVTSVGGEVQKAEQWETVWEGVAECDDCHGAQGTYYDENDKMV